ncbi:MAG: hypothetical protein RLZZ203_898 [Cyanobacteriota bacterium]
MVWLTPRFANDYAHQPEAGRETQFLFDNPAWSKLCFGLQSVPHLPRNCCTNYEILD